MKTRIALAVSAFVLALVAGAFAQTPLPPGTYKADPPKYTGTTTVQTNAEKKVEPKCPISGKPINKEYAVDFDGGKVYMCCENCPAAFKKDSAKYAAKAHLQMVQTGELSEALKEFAAALDANKNSSLAHYRIAEVFFQQRNYQAAANAYRESINGDGDPRWTEVWSHVQLGKIFDVTGQRERATNEYRHALETNDNTEGAQDEARKYLKQPYEKQKSTPGS